MCLAVPSKIISKENLLATVDVFGARREVSLALVSDELAVGDYVLVHAGFAITKVDEEYALDTLQLLKELNEVMEESDKKAICDHEQREAPADGAKG
jgi:hydrogenase expression/formation protein HypC